MMKKSCIYTLLSLLLALGLVFGCQKKQKEAPPPVEEKEEEILEPVAEEKAPTMLEGYITYLSGVVSIDRGTGWVPCDIDDFVGVDHCIKTEPESFCEVQFTDFGIIRIQESTEVAMMEIYLKEQENSVDVDLKNGDLLCKVSKLAKSEKFQVTTDTALAGVRGTEFLVKTREGEATKVAVSKGEVRVVPVEIVRRIEDIKLELKSETAKQTLEEIILPEIIVTDSEEVTVGKEQAARAAEEFREISDVIEQKVKQIDEKAFEVEEKEKEIEQLPEKKAEKTKAQVQEIRADIETLKRDVVSVVEQKKAVIEEEVLQKPESVTPEIKEELEEIEKLKPKEAEMVIARKEVEEKEEEKIIYTKVIIKVDPKDAVVFVNGEERGKGTIKEIYEPGTVLTIRAEIEGYEPKELEVEISEERQQEIVIELVRYTKVRLKAEPKDARILIEGKQAGRGSVENFYQPGATILVRAELDGWEATEKRVKVLDRKEQEILISLKRVKRPVSWKVRAADSEIVRGIVVSDGRIFAADRGGTVHCLSLTGERLWNAVSANTSNENSMPVAAGNLVVFSGEKQLLVVNRSGRAVANRGIGDTTLSSHLFGRKVLFLNGTIVYPSNSALLLLDSRSLNESKRIPVPGNSNSSPAAWNGKILIADRDGTLLIIDPDTGKVTNQIETNAVQPVSHAPSIMGNLCCFAGRKGTVVLIDLQKGKVSWESKVDGGVFQDIAIGEKGCYPFTGKTFFSLSVKNGRALFTPVSSSCPPLYHRGRLFFGTEDGQFVVMDASTGRTLTQCTLDGPITARPVSIEGEIVAATRPGTLYRLKPDDM
jgi:outer membrane protein assembly factor BamB